LLLTLLVLWHSRQWLLARAFVVCGGLQTLLLLLDPHLRVKQLLRCHCVSRCSVYLRY
jgi:hypothetical protein